MKSFKLKVMIAIMAVMFISPYLMADGDVREVILKEAGTLKDSLNNESATKVQTLILSGPVNGTDISFIRNSMNNLCNLNMTNATIVTGGDAYLRKFKTKADTIGEEMFSSMIHLQGIDLPYNLKGIEKSAFAHCSNLTSIGIPEGVACIEEGTFEDCAALTEVYLPSTLTSIGNGAFKKSALLEIKIPENVISLGENVFDGCDSLHTITCLPPTPPKTKEDCFTDSIYANATLNVPYASKTVYAYFTPWKLFGHIVEGYNPIAFVKVNEAGKLKETIGGDESRTAAITNLKVVGPINGTDVDFIRSLQNMTFMDLSEANIVAGGNDYYGSFKTQNDTVGMAMFCYLGNLKTAILPNTTKAIGMSAFIRCYDLEDVTIPSSVQSIGSWAFSMCTSLQKINLPESITSLEDNTFTDCVSLEDVELPKTLSHIGDGVFKDCSSLMKITIPENVESIGKDVFIICDSLKEIHCLNPIAPIGSEETCDSSVYAQCKLFIVAGSKDSYTHTEPWKYFKQIEEGNHPDGLTSNTVGATCHAYSSRKSIVIDTEGSDMKKISIYSIDGKLVKALESKGGRTVIDSIDKGIYIVKAGNDTFKVAVN